ncbi:uncharacterized protein EDB93DRAFT_591539 [Suillus bovinus]|uniref:uncharacterized protein n=1 Tax=Suillus bovinus TaxID=48563 RepID=UPI001B86994B|nr:uncharacterized protein EDB93DRAFT_591539 [Suillus bovinus]KAG2143473.1 hypothetical protein EDB93DRAFT_591539 [Suillus bovinus]
MRRSWIVMLLVQSVIRDANLDVDDISHVSMPRGPCHICPFPYYIGFRIPLRKLDFCDSLSHWPNSARVVTELPVFAVALGSALLVSYLWYKQEFHPTEFHDMVQLIQVISSNQSMASRKPNSAASAENRYRY